MYCKRDNCWQLIPCALHKTLELRPFHALIAALDLFGQAATMEKNKQYPIVNEMLENSIQIKACKTDTCRCGPDKHFMHFRFLHFDQTHNSIAEVTSLILKIFMHNSNQMEPGTEVHLDEMYLPLFDWIDQMKNFSSFKVAISFLDASYCYRVICSSTFNESPVTRMNIANAEQVIQNHIQRLVEKTTVLFLHPILLKGMVILRFVCFPSTLLKENYIRAELLKLFKNKRSSVRLSQELGQYVNAKSLSTPRLHLFFKN